MFNMPRTKGSKNKKTLEKENLKESPTVAIKKIAAEINAERSSVLLKEKKTVEKMKSESPQIEFKEVVPRNDPPKIPECLIDGGMLYRWLNDVRRTYLDEKVEKKEIKIINEIMDYIMRMEKHERDNKGNQESQKTA